MALKLQRRAEMITSENLLHRRLRRHPDQLRTGAGSFKRLLGSPYKTPSARGLLARINAAMISAQISPRNALTAIRIPQSIQKVDSRTKRVGQTIKRYTLYRTATSAGPTAPQLISLAAETVPAERPRSATAKTM